MVVYVTDCVCVTVVLSCVCDYVRLSVTVLCVCVYSVCTMIVCTVLYCMRVAGRRSDLIRRCFGYILASNSHRLCSIYSTHVRRFQ